MRIRLNRMHFPVTALGPGRRIGVWVQGCGIGCPGCVARDTWAPDAGKLVEIEAVVEFCRALGKERIDGVTISGGEPFEQPEALAALLDALDAWRCEGRLSIEFLCYSGLPLARLRKDFGDILARLDAIIPEPFVKGLSGERRWRGSRNQPLVPLSELGRARYADVPESGAAPFQVAVEDGRVWFIGVPGAGSMERLETACAALGVVLENTSWRA